MGTIFNVALPSLVDQTSENERDEEEHEPKWQQIVGGPFTKQDELCVDIRRLQQRSGASDATCDDILRTFSKYLGIEAPNNFRDYDKKMQEAAGATVLRLDGCVKCNRHVYHPDDRSKHCPKCGHRRYGDSGKPLEVMSLFIRGGLFKKPNTILCERQRVFYFPLKSKLQALMKLPSYKKLLQHEFERDKNDLFFSDVYDSPAWQKFMGEVVYPNDRIGKESTCMWNLRDV